MNLYSAGCERAEESGQCFWATSKFLWHSPDPRNIAGPILEHPFQQGQHEQVSLNLISSMMLFISLNQTGILLMSVQDRLYLSCWKGHQELYSWAVNRKKKNSLLMNCFTGKPAASTREASEKAQRSEVKRPANCGWLLGGQSPCTQWWNPITSAKPSVLGEPGVMGWKWLSDLTAVNSVLCLPMGGFLASHLGAEEDAR